MTEFRADRAAVELMGEATSFNVVMERLSKEAPKVWREMNITPQASTFLERLERRVKLDIYSLKSKLFRYHPSRQERIEKATSHLASLKKTGGAIDAPPF